MCKFLSCHVNLDLHLASYIAKFILYVGIVAYLIVNKPSYFHVHETTLSSNRVVNFYVVYYHRGNSKNQTHIDCHGCDCSITVIDNEIDIYNCTSKLSQKTLKFFFKTIDPCPTGPVFYIWWIDSDFNITDIIEENFLGTYNQFGFSIYNVALSAISTDGTLLFNPTSTYLYPSTLNHSLPCSANIRVDLNQITINISSSTAKDYIYYVVLLLLAIFDLLLSIKKSRTPTKDDEFPLLELSETKSLMIS